jgi:hypothetical protein
LGSPDGFADIANPPSPALRYVAGYDGLRSCIPLIAMIEPFDNGAQSGSAVRFPAFADENR